MAKRNKREEPASAATMAAMDRTYAHEEERGLYKQHVGKVRTALKHAMRDIERAQLALKVSGPTNEDELRVRLRATMSLHEAHSEVALALALLRKP